MIYLLNRKSTELHLSPFYLALVAFCFSMTVGVLWEFFESSMDIFFMMDMQKDHVIRQFASVALDPDNAGQRILVRDITRTVIETVEGTKYVVNGYLDIGVYDTMKDLFVNFLGALTFSVFGYLYERFHPDRSIAKDMMWKPRELAPALPEEQ